MVITLVIFYYLYLLVVLLFVIGGLVNIYHLLRFGFSGLTNILVIVIFVAVGALLLFYSMAQMQAVDWSLPIIDFRRNNLVDQNIFY